MNKAIFIIEGNISENLQKEKRKKKMSMQIEFDEHYNEVATYTGKVNGEFYFTVKVYWDSISKNYIPKVVDFSDDISVNFDKQKAKYRIISLVKEWYYLDK